MIVPANSADTAGDEVRIPRVFAFHENAVSPENRGRAVTLRDLPVFKIDLRENS
jgi:hypothetical protein